MTHEIEALVAELHSRAAYYMDRPAVPDSEYPTEREISAIEAKATASLLRRAAEALSPRTQ
jgi:hypothetical protein